MKTIIRLAILSGIATFLVTGCSKLGYLVVINRESADLFISVRNAEKLKVPRDSHAVLREVLQGTIEFQVFSPGGHHLGGIVLTSEDVRRRTINNGFLAGDTVLVLELDEYKDQ